MALKKLLGLIPVLLFSCQTEQAPKPTAAVDVKDSVAMTLALTPTMESLPFYYAHETGLFQEAELPVRLLTFRSQWDADTAMLGTTADGGVTDLVRLCHHALEGKDLTAVCELSGKWRWLGDAEKTRGGLSSMKGHTVALSRYAASDFYSSAVLRDSAIDYQALLRPQINDYRLRAVMLDNSQVNSAVLPEPFATQARMHGHRLLADADEQVGCLAFSRESLTDSTQAKRVATLLKVYNQAVALLNRQGASACKTLLVEEYGVQPDVADSLTLPKFLPAQSPDADDFQNVLDFLKKQNRQTDGLDQTILMDSRFIPVS